jgi:hypothetical protein
MGSVFSVSLCENNSVWGLGFIQQKIQKICVYLRTIIFLTWFLAKNKEQRYIFNSLDSKKVYGIF